MKTLNNVIKISLATLVAMGSISVAQANGKKEVTANSYTFGVQEGLETTVKSKYNFTYDPIPGMKLPAAGSKQTQQHNPMNLSLNEHGTIVTDHNTKLQWASRTLLVWTNLLKATEYCANLRTGGYDDWRIPTLKELTSINDFDSFEPSFSRKYFPGVPTIPSGYWAVPQGTGHPLNAWHVGYDGHVMGQSADSTKMTRCVRADGQKAYDKNLFKDNGDGTVTDDITSLVWQQTDDGKARQFKDATSYCKDLVLGGRDDWRLPHVKEMISIMNYYKHRPAMDEEFFKEIKPEFYWTSSIDPSYGTNTITGKTNNVRNLPKAWATETMSGGTWRYIVENENYVRCVTDKK